MFSVTWIFAFISVLFVLVSSCPLIDELLYLRLLLGTVTRSRGKVRILSRTEVPVFLRNTDHRTMYRSLSLYPHLHLLKCLGMG